MKTKTQELQEVLAEADTLRALMESSEDGNTEENQAKFDSYLDQIILIQSQIAKEAALKSARDFLQTPEGNGSKTAGFVPVGGDGANAEAWAGVPDLGHDFINLESYQQVLKTISSLGKVPKLSDGITLESKGFLSPAMIRQEIARNQKATFTSAGLTSIMRVPGIVQLGQLRLTVADLLATGQTQATTVRYMQENTFTNAATTVAEGGTKPEATFDVSEKDAPVRKIAVTAKVTDELFADYPAMRDYVNNRLRFMVQLKEEQQLVGGLGTGSEITGILSTAGIQTLAGSKATAAEDLLKAADKIRVNSFFEPDGIVINPLDYQPIRLLKDLNAQYYAGGPFQNEYGVGGVPVSPPLWGLPVVITPAVPAGTALVGAFKIGAQVFYREGITLDMTNSNVDDFVKNLLTIRCEERLALCVYRPKAFCTVTAINV
jgi:HK97 family phage major capsid protein